MHHEPARDGPGKIKGEIEATWWNAITAGWRFWPFVHTLTFSPLIPQDFKLLFVDCVEVVWVTILSAAVNRDSEKALQVPLNAEAERPGIQLTEQMDSQFASVVDGVETQFDPGEVTVEHIRDHSRSCPRETPAWSPVC